MNWKIPERFNNRLNEAEERISQLKDKGTELRAAERKKKNERKWSQLKGFMAQHHTNIHIIGHPEGKKKGVKILFEQIMAENFPNLGGELDSNPGSPENSK